MKAIFEINMPESCAECRLLFKDAHPVPWCIPLGVGPSATWSAIKRLDICPLKIVSDDAPTVDAVPVKCKNCVYYHPDDSNDEICHRIGGMTEPADDDYCSFGVTKGG